VRLHIVVFGLAINTCCVCANTEPPNVSVACKPSGASLGENTPFTSFFADKCAISSVNRVGKRGPSLMEPNCNLF
jgi:hypothetical protein